MLDFHYFLLYLLIFCITALLGFSLVARARRTFLFIRPELLRRNVVTFLIGLCFFFALGHLIPDFHRIMLYFGWWKGFCLCALIVVLNVLLPYNIVLYITEGKRFSGMDFMRQQVAIFVSIVISSIVTNSLLNLWLNNGTRNLKYSMAWSFYIAGFGSLIYLFMRQNEQEKKKKLFEKELEVARLSEGKTKAELDALQSKINPHFLYNVLNSIADLAVTNGDKARQMTVALADLFRHSLNYSKGNFATVKEEVETAGIYLAIEKIRFEDQLQYSVLADEEADGFLLPKFVLQPLIENAVKHGLKKTQLPTQVNVYIRLEPRGLVVRIEDNGPPFPGELVPGYGLKSVYDKLELLFPGSFELEMVNGDPKYLQLLLKEPIKNERTL